MKKAELLAPAGDINAGYAALYYGADAVYLGLRSFSARAGATNFSPEELNEFTAYAHHLNRKVYVTLNTLIQERELNDLLKMLDICRNCRVDGIIVQDLGVARLIKENYPELTLHASTQMAVHNKEGALALKKLGFQRVVLARELSLKEIKEIASIPDLETEAFIHGALCYAYSGLCLFSSMATGRSANRGACIQACRSRYDLTDADGRILVRDKALLSLKDYQLKDRLEDLADAGVCSFKIEGRLKNASYVKNCVRAYSEAIDELVAANPEKYVRASFGRVSGGFKPELDRTFNRGYTDYFLYGRKPSIENLVTPKSVGMPVGKVKDRARYWFSVATSEAFANGDGLCFIDEKKRMQGFRINKVEGNRLIPQSMPEDLKKGTMLFRNHDEAFTRLLQGKTAERKLEMAMRLEVGSRRLSLVMVALQGKDSLNSHARSTDYVSETPFDEAAKPQEDNIRRNLCKLGNTPFSCADVEIVWTDGKEYFVPVSVITRLRQTAVGEKLEQLVSRHETNLSRRLPLAADSETLQTLSEAVLVQSADRIAKGPLMECRHCIRYALGYCPKTTSQRPPWQEPLSLKMGDGRRFRLQFDCKKCQMNVML